MKSPNDHKARRREYVLHLACRKSTGFTLIELLVVISVIALLMGILMPSLRRAREQAYRVVDMSNLRQVQMAWQLYADDHDGQTFTFRIGHRPDQWPYMLHRYTSKSWGIFLPFRGADPLGMSDVPQWAVDKWTKDPYWDCGGYMVGLFARAVFPAFGYNEQGWTPLFKPGGGWVKKLKGLNVYKAYRPSEKLVFGTTVGMSTTFKGYGWYRLTPYRQLTYPEPGTILWSGAPPLTQNSYGGLSPRWSGKTNISLADGHCEAVDPTSLTDVHIWDPQRK